VTGKWVRGGERARPQTGVIVAVQPYELHGTPYYSVLFRYDGDPPEGARQARLSADMAYESPQPGDRVLIDAVLGVVDRIRRADSA